MEQTSADIVVVRAYFRDKSGKWLSTNWLPVKSRGKCIMMKVTWSLEVTPPNITMNCWAGPPEIDEKGAESCVPVNL
ncbi:MAG: hypothetical protein M5U34_26795, partial [Chloroflexi bacterium]|nr:hypothetical protein [Chloroflexota bacterium]